jgi:hypothetical protein
LQTKLNKSTPDFNTAVKFVVNMMRNECEREVFYTKWAKLVRHFDPVVEDDEDNVMNVIVSQMSEIDMPWQMRPGKFKDLPVAQTSRLTEF